MTSSNKRQRQLAREKYERQQHRRAAAADRRRLRQRIVAAVVIAVLVVGGGAWFVVNRMQQPADVAAEAAPSSSPLASASAQPSSTASTAASASAVALACTDPGPTRADNLSWPSAPAASALSEATATITLATNCGSIAIQTLPEQAPLTVASEVFLTQQGFYDQTSCHRLTTEGIYVLQCGDPKGDGTGGPGYAVPDENVPAESDANYPAGTVAMANAGPGTAGSQFFIVYQDTTLPAGYTIWGKVTSGLDLVQQIAAAGVSGGGSDGPPAQPVTIQQATVSAS